MNLHGGKGSLLNPVKSDFWPSKFTFIPCAKYIHPIPTLKTLTHAIVNSKVNISCTYHRLQKFQILSFTSNLGEKLDVIYPGAAFPSNYFPNETKTEVISFKNAVMGPA